MWSLLRTLYLWAKHQECKKPFSPVEEILNSYFKNNIVILVKSYNSTSNLTHYPLVIKFWSINEIESQNRKKLYLLLLHHYREIYGSSQHYRIITTSVRRLSVQAPKKCQTILHQKVMIFFSIYKLLSDQHQQSWQRERLIFSVPSLVDKILSFLINYVEHILQGLPPLNATRSAQ